jgi:hypothetical protein
MTRVQLRPYQGFELVAKVSTGCTSGSIGASVVYNSPAHSHCNPTPFAVSANAEHEVSPLSTRTLYPSLYPSQDDAPTGPEREKAQYWAFVTEMIGKLCRRM